MVDLEAEGLRQHILQESIRQIDSERSAMQETSRLVEWKVVYEKLSKGECRDGNSLEISK